MPTPPSTARRVGLLLLVALALGMAAIFTVGERRNLFSAKNDYFIRFDSVSGLQPGSNVQLDGVGVGSIAAIDLSEDVRQNQIEIRIRVEERFAARIRDDSMARIRTLGLLGDKYIEISSGTSQFPEIPEGGAIGTAPVADVDRLRASGEDLVNNVTRITEQLTTILGRMERGEGILGELTRDVEPNRKVTTEFIATLDSIRGMFDEFRNGAGPLPRMLGDRTLGDKLESTVTRLDSLLGQAESGGGALSMLLTDGEQKARLERSLASIERTTANLESASASLREERALLPKLLGDEAYGEKLSGELQSLLENLNRVAGKIDHGTGSAAQIINDPQLYQAMKDIVVGIDESAILRRLIRNRQKKGIEVRLEQSLDAVPAPPPAKQP
ncbi:MAG: MCE family protein [Thermoanaerobaculia bacterium]|nr:MCE family protein [Thermoanaerobaculia bacterium]